jgi:hypothetical protein
LSFDPETRRRQNDLLAEYRDRHKALEPAITSLRPGLRMPLARLALATLRSQDAATRQHVVRTLTRAMQADEKVSLFEFTLTAMARRELEFDLPSKVERSDRKLAEVSAEVAALLSALATAGTENEAAAAAAFSVGIKLLNLPPGSVNFVPTDDCARLGESLEQLGACSLSLRQAVVQAGAAVIDADGMRTPDEIELLRVIAAALGCPVSLPA